ncbi:19804_t:CDS:1, partial [Dentiscutata erythropus]
FSDTNHTANFLTNEIQKVLIDIEVKKFISIVTDAESNINL